ncbi:MAG: DUF642 domain-containing protein [Patescibacteria group bacterium]|nr:DUF642 domain-containing protein [Patescibacteria group bacterium]
MSAFEAHVVNVTAKIENALDVPITELDFGTVFPEEVLNKTMAVNLSESFMEQAQCSTTSIIENGGFEIPEVTNPAKWETFPVVPGWNITWVNPGDAPAPALIEYQAGVNGWNSHEGNQWTELASDWGQAPNSLPNDARVIISQEISTTVGAKYTLTYWYSGRPGQSSADNMMDVRVNGITKPYAENNPGANTNWKEDSIEFVATASTTKIEFQGTGANHTYGMFLDDVSLVECGRVSTVDYVLRQKPKCVDDNNSSIHPQVTHNTNGDFACPEGSTMMPLLCPYLSKSETTNDGGEGQNNDGVAIAAFHGPLTGWTMKNTEDWQTGGTLSAAIGDIMDEWLIDLHAPCFKGMCAQDNKIDPEYQADPALEHAVFGCDLWLEVTGID